MGKFRTYLFEIGEFIAPFFTEKRKRYIFTFVLGVFALYSLSITYPDESILEAIRSSYIIEMMWVLAVFGLVFLVVTVFSSAFLLFFEVSQDDIFGRILSSTYVASIYMEYFSLIRHINAGKVRGLLSRWNKNVHELLALHLSMTFMYFPFLILIIGFYITIVISENVSVGLSRSAFLDAILWTIGILIAVLFFFFRYITDQIDTKSLIRHFPYLVVSLIGFSISILFAIFFLTYPWGSEQDIANIFTLGYFSLSILFLSVILVRIISIPFTNGIMRIQKRAAKRDIFKQASSEARVKIAEKIVEKAGNNSEIEGVNFETFSGKDLGFHKRQTITDINKSVLKYITDNRTQSVSSIQIERGLGEEIIPSEILIRINTDSNIDPADIDRLSRAFKTTEFNPAEYKTYRRANRYTNLENYISKIEQKCKSSIDRGNITHLNQLFNSYSQMASAIGQQRSAYNRENIELGYCSEILASSMTDIFVHYLNSTSRELENECGERILSEIIYTVYKLYDYSEEDTMSDECKHFSKSFQAIVNESGRVKMYDYPNIGYIEESIGRFDS